jgi:hypothetical protein
MCEIPITLAGLFVLYLLVKAADNGRSCPYCKEGVHWHAVVCPHCQRDITESADPPHKHRMGFLPRFVILLLAIPAGLFLLFVFSAISG